MKSALLALETLILALLSALVLTGCAIHRPTTTTIPVETIKEAIKVDTIYLSNVKYDSIYINNVSYTDRSGDTLLIRETNTEYRYRLLSDTIESIKIEFVHDSIPIIQQVEIEKEVRFIPGWCKCLSLIGVCTIVLLILLILWKLR